MAKRELNPTQVKQALFEGRVVENRGGWLMKINDNDDIEIWPPKGDGFATHIGRLDEEVRRFCKEADMPLPGVNETQGPAVSLPSAAEVLEKDTSTKEYPKYKPTVNETPKGTDQRGTSTSNPRLGPDTSDRNPRNFDPAINKRPRPDEGRGGLPDTGLGEDTAGADTNWGDRKIRNEKDARRRARGRIAAIELSDGMYREEHGDAMEAAEAVYGWYDYMREEVDFDFPELPDPQEFFKGEEPTVDGLNSYISEIEDRIARAAGHETWMGHGRYEVSPASEMGLMLTAEEIEDGGDRYGRRRAEDGGKDPFKVKINKEPSLNKGENPSDPSKIIDQEKGEGKDLRDEKEGRRRARWSEVSKAREKGDLDELKGHSWQVLVGDEVVYDGDDYWEAREVLEEVNAKSIRGELPEVNTTLLRDGVDVGGGNKLVGSRIVDSFDAPPDASHIYKEMKRVRPSEQLLKDIMDPDKWAANNVFAPTRDARKDALRAMKQRRADVPKKWEKTVKKMKGDPGIDNPYALANWMEGEGYTPGGRDEKKKSNRRQAGPKLREKWSPEGAYGRDIEAESAEELHALTLAFGGEEVDWSPFRPKTPEEGGEVEGQAPMEQAPAVQARRRAQVGESVHWDVVRKEMEGEEWQIDPENPEDVIRQVDLGPIYALSPFGRSYLPGPGGQSKEEAAAEKEWRQNLESEAAEYGYILREGEPRGKGVTAFNLFVVEVKDRNEVEDRFPIEKSSSVQARRLEADVAARAEELVEQWVNGNRKDVIAEVTSSHPLLAARVYEYLNDDYDKQVFMRMLESTTYERDEEGRISSRKQSGRPGKFEGVSDELLNLAEELYGETPDEQETEGDLWYGFYASEKAILTESGQGFVNIEVFDTEEEAQEVWDQISGEIGEGWIEGVGELEGYYFHDPKENVFYVFGDRELEAAGNVAWKHGVDSQEVSSSPLKYIRDEAAEANAEVEVDIQHGFRGDYDRDHIREYFERGRSATARRQAQSAEMEAVDEKAKDYWSGYMGEYGKQLSEEGDVSKKNLPKGKGEGKMRGKGKGPLGVPKDLKEKEGRRKRREAWLRAKREAQAAAPMAQPAAPAPAPAAPAVPVGPVPGAPAAPAAPGAAPPKAPGAKPEGMPPGTGDAGLQSLGWTPEEISLMDEEDKKKILEIKLNKPGTKKKGPEKPMPGAPKTPAAPPVPGPMPGPGAPAPAAPMGPAVSPPVAKRMARMILKKINQRRAQMAPGTLPEQPAAEPAPAPAQQPAAPMPEFGGQGQQQPKALPVEQQAFQILAEVQSMPVNATSPEQVTTQKVAELSKRLLLELGINLSDARKLFGIPQNKSMSALFE